MVHAFEEMIAAVVATYLQLRANPDAAALALGLVDAVDDSLGVALEVEGPLVEVAGTESNQHHLDGEERR